MSFYLLALVIFGLDLYPAHGLVCLQCDDILQPRHCHTVAKCDADEACFTTWSPDSHRYRLGCLKRSICTNSTSSSTKTCDECCSDNLCNAGGCSELGYPAPRGPICYDCKYHNDHNPCTNIDICSVNEECSVHGRSEFGDKVLSSGCKLKHICQAESAGPSTIIGKRSVQSVRSISKTLCNECCAHDLCNLNCSVNPCLSSPCQHGSCSSAGSSFRCHCHSGWSGLTCNQTNYCTSSPCVNGVCVNEIQDFRCQCSNGTYGDLCENTDNCYSSPCHHGSCSSNGTSFQCHCPSGWLGLTCEHPDYCASSPCVNGACVNIPQGFRCQCPNVFYGHRCENVNYCLSSPCIHGSCFNNQTSFICLCSRGWTGTLCETAIIGFDCLDILQRGLSHTDGVYSIRLNNTGEIIEVYCDMTSDGGGWTVFQKRFNGSVDFYRNFSDCDNGFGSIYGEFWLGLKYVYQMTVGVVNELRLDLGKHKGETAFEVYQNFFLSGYPRYTLHIGAYSGTAGDSGAGLSYNNGYPFSTFDKLQGPIRRCPINAHGSWWYGDCSNANLNGDYITPGTQHANRVDAGVIYYQWSHYASLKSTEMKFRRK